MLFLPALFFFLIKRSSPAIACLYVLCLDLLPARLPLGSLAPEIFISQPF